MRKNTPPEKGIVGKAFEKIDTAVQGLHARYPILSVMSDAQGNASQQILDNLYETREKIIDKTKLLIKIDPAEQIRVSTIIEAAAARMPSKELGDALRSCVYVGSSGVILTLSGCGGGQSAVDRIANEGRGSMARKTGGDYVMNGPVTWIVGGLAEAILLSYFYKIGEVGFDGDRIIDDKLASLVLGVVVQIMTTIMASKEGWDSPYAWGAGTAIAATTLLASVKYLIKGPNDGTND